MICLGDTAIFFQIKERGDTPKKPTEERQIRWFNEKILGKAVDQMMGSLRTFETEKELDFWNLRKQRRKIRYSTLKNKHYIVLHHSKLYVFPRECYARKSQKDETTNSFIHIMTATDWLNLCRYLVTIPDIIYYLSFREKYLKEIMDSRKEKEKWLLGRFLRSPQVPNIELDCQSLDYSKWVDNLDTKDFILEKFNLIIKSLGLV
ncbi:hypothetical protein GF359_00320 [candidate division WOR-3 bacterium]|uniref:Uncharacterized protein n=1 Tax=candidate division WOR-3 bacterium TaxID=2052148 RepID=A0A9D5K7E6_UNCW3|nr:hypothetical protein [candidate division WOR-3 bacterium]MBD3363637.1 hypothetical protein [candidate division WOR-3 bacterium]